MIPTLRRRRACRSVGVAVVAASAALLWTGCGPAQLDIINYAGHFRPNPTVKIHPSAIVLHWWGGRSGGRGINTLVDVLNSRRLSVQLGTLQNGKTYQLTDTLDTRAAHASCANSYAIGNEIEGGGNGTSSDMINNAAQFNAVVDTTAFLMRKYHIPLNGPVLAGGRGVVGVHSHKEIDAMCNRTGKVDVDNAYMKKVRAALRARGF